MASERRSIEIKIGDANKFKTTLDSLLREVGVDASDSMNEAIDEIGKEAVRKMQLASPVRKPKYGKDKGYAKAWKFKKNAKGRNGQIESKVYNERGNLTHILEYGHPIVRNGKVVGNADPQPHIEPVNEWVQQELPRRFTSKMQNK